MGTVANTYMHTPAGAVRAAFDQWNRWLDASRKPEHGAEARNYMLGRAAANAELFEVLTGRKPDTCSAEDVQQLADEMPKPVRYEPLTVKDVKIRAAVHRRNSVPFERLHVGYVAVSDIGEVECCIDETTRAPILKMPDNRHVAFGWSPLVEAAVAAWLKANV